MNSKATKGNAAKITSHAEATASDDAGGLSPELQKLSKPAQRALLAQGIRDARDLAKWTRADFAKFHGVGPASFPILEAAMKSAGVKFRS